MIIRPGRPQQTPMISNTAETNTGRCRKQLRSGEKCGTQFLEVALPILDQTILYNNNRFDFHYYFETELKFNQHIHTL